MSKIEASQQSLIKGCTSLTACLEQSKLKSATWALWGTSRLCLLQKQLLCLLCS